jgi:hypothetical protein
MTASGPGSVRGDESTWRTAIGERLADADLLWQHGRREGALLSTLVAVATAARSAHPQLHDGDAFRQFVRDNHAWTITVEYQKKQVDLDQLLYKWMRCELVHNGTLPVDLRIDADFADPASLSVRAGGAPDHTVLLTPGWYDFLTGIARAGADQTR